MGNGNQDLVRTWTDPRAERFLEGAEASLERARADLAAWVAENLGRLAADRYSQAREIAQQLKQARAVYAEAGSRWEREVQAWNGLLVEAGIEHLLGDVAATPVSQHLPAVDELPFPASFVPEVMA